MHCPKQNKKFVLSYVTNICGCREFCICYVTFCVARESSKRKFPQLLTFKGAISNFQAFFGEIVWWANISKELLYFGKIDRFLQFWSRNHLVSFRLSSARQFAKNFVLLEVFQPITAQLGYVMCCIMIGRKASRRTKCSRAPEVNKMVST